ncbi:Choline-sulfatase [Planctomycetes bacterium CA13]|uniref:Choline-sulfatase n=2 Tax=Novipirellula herctigrandis TaxID=2527986 RepID=A0A5C5Z6G0_9BACT|nr:Choline-sulfatase [Planctomycetes bacterium CA13]
MDSLAKSGTYFKNAFVAYPVCSASKAAFYTGLHSHTNGILNNTHNYHKPAERVTEEERNRRLAIINRVRDEFVTMTEILKRNGYYQGVTHKLHVYPNEKFPYDEFLHGRRAELSGFLNRAKKRGQPWFLMVNIANSHRPYPNSDKKSIRVSPTDVELPKYLPDSPVIRKDWAEYLAAIEETDALTGEAIDVLDQSGQRENTIIVFMSDHGPTFQHGKMTLYDLGLRVPLSFSGPGIKKGQVSDALISELDLLPTLVDLCQLESPIDYPLHGQSMAAVLRGQPNENPREYVFAEISNLGPLPNDGIQERSVFDGRWKLIYRENVEKKWRQVNADSRQFKTWGNRTYAETIRLKDKFPRQFQILVEMDPQNFDASVPPLELYDLASDPDEMNNLASDERFAKNLARLQNALVQWCKATDDSSLRLHQEIATP